MQRLKIRCLGMMLAVLMLASHAATAQAQLLSVSVAGVDTLLDTVKYTMKMAGQEEIAGQLDGVINAYLQGNGFKGIDTKKPIGAYLNKFPDNPTQPALVLYVPVTNEADFLAFLSSLNVTPSNPDKGIRSIGLPTGQQLYFSFKSNYAFFCLDEDELKSPTEPAKLAANVPANSLFHVHVGLNEIPQEMKDRFLSELDKALKAEQAKKDGESEAHYQGRLLGMKMPRQAIESLVRDSQSFSATLTLDQNKHRSSFEATLTPKPGSSLHNEMKAMGASQSKFTSLFDSAPVTLVYHGMMTDNVRKDFDNLLDNFLKKAIAEEKSVMKKAVAEKIYQVLEPTLKDKKYELALSVRMPANQKHMTGLAAVHVKNGKQIEDLFKGLLEEVKEKDRSAIQLDAARFGDVNIHEINFPANDDGAKEIVNVFGSSKVSLAFHQEAVVIGVGTDGTEQIKRVLDSLGKSSSGNPSPMQFRMHVKPFARFIKEAPVRKAFETAFTAADSDEISVTVTGGDQVRWQIEASTVFIKLIAAIEKANRE